MNETRSKPSTAAGPPAPSASLSSSAQDVHSGFRLLPDQPPGRCTRKALPFAGEIRRLHDLGYTLEAIKQALAAAGVAVSRSTVHREVRRRAAPASLRFPVNHADATSAAAPTHSHATESRATRARDPPPSTETSSHICKEGAEAFFQSHDINPLFKSKESP